MVFLGYCAPNPLPEASGLGNLTTGSYTCCKNLPKSGLFLLIFGPPKFFSPTCQFFCTDISVISVTFCNSDFAFFPHSVSFYHLTTPLIRQCLHSDVRGVQSGEWVGWCGIQWFSKINYTYIDRNEISRDVVEMVRPYNEWFYLSKNHRTMIPFSSSHAGTVTLGAEKW